MRGALGEAGGCRRRVLVPHEIGGRERQPQLRGEERHRAGESLGRDADDGERLARQGERTADERRVEAGAAPVLVGGDRDPGRRRGALLLGREASSAVHRDSERLEVVGGDDRDERLAGHARLLRHAGHRHVDRREVLEHPAPVPKVHVVGVRDAPVGAGGPGAGIVDADDLAGPAAVQRLEQHGVDQREHGRVHADPEREHQHGDEREARRLDQHPRSDAHVLEQPAHESSPVTASLVDGAGLASVPRAGCREREAWPRLWPSRLGTGEARGHRISFTAPSREEDPC